jgi:hypothetical protein
LYIFSFFCSLSFSSFLISSFFISSFFIFNISSLSSLIEIENEVESCFVEELELFSLDENYFCKPICVHMSMLAH